MPGSLTEHAEINEMIAMRYITLILCAWIKEDYYIKINKLKRLIIQKRVFFVVSR